VAVSAAEVDTPAAPKILGFTAIIYAMVRKVVRPPRRSVESELPRCEYLKNLSISYSSDLKPT
jgi:hypothetical protein